MGRSIARPLSLAASILLALLWSGDAILTVSVVTGANKGIGLATAKKLAQTPGHLCILTSREPAKGAQALKEMQQEGMDAVCKQLDISGGSSVERFVSEMEAEYGRCDVLVNNAGIAFKNSDPTPFRDQARPTLMTNFFNTVDFTEAMLPLVRKSNLGRIVNVASGSGRLSILKSEALREQFTDPTLTLAKLKALMNRFIDDVEAGRHDSEGWPSSCYGMSKLGLIAYTKVAARIEEEFGSGVIVNACSPGYTATDMTSHMGEQTPEEGARMPYMLTQMGSSGEARLTGAFYRLGELTEW